MALNLSLKLVLAQSKSLNICCSGCVKWYSRTRDSELLSKADEPESEPGSDTQNSTKKHAPFSPGFMKFRRRSLSPMQRLGTLIAEHKADSEIENTAEKIQEGNLASNKSKMSKADEPDRSELDSVKLLNQKNNIMKQRHNVIPSKRLKSMIPEEYWRTEDEDSKDIVDNLDSNIDTKHNENEK